MHVFTSSQNVLCYGVTSVQCHPQTEHSMPWSASQSQAYKCGLDYTKCIYILFSWSSVGCKLVTTLTTIEGKLSCFSWFFTLNYKSFPVNYGLVDWQYMSTKMLLQMFFCKQSFFTQNAKVVPCGSFVVCSKCGLI